MMRTIEISRVRGRSLPTSKKIDRDLMLTFVIGGLSLGIATDFLGVGGGVLQELLDISDFLWLLRGWVVRNRRIWGVLPLIKRCSFCFLTMTINALLVA